MSLQILARQDKPGPCWLCVSRSRRMLLSRVAISSMPGVSTLPAMTTMSAVRLPPPAVSTVLTPAVIVLLRLRPESWLPRRRNIPLQIRLYLLHLQTERPLHLKNSGKS